MKKILFILLLVANLTAYSQAYSDLQPSWAKVTPIPPAGANYFLSWGLGEGYSEQQAINDAWADALRKSLHELGVVGITQQDIDAVAKNGIDAVVSFNKMKRRQLCTTSAIPLSGGKVKIYVMIQVQRSIHDKDDFYDVNPNLCADPDFDRRLREWKDGIYGFSPRVFVPGMAQLHKGSTLKGTLFIAGEVAMIGGIVLAESLRASYNSKINTTHSAADKKTYINNADNWQNIRNGFIAGAAAVYVWNVIDGIVAKGKKHVIVLGSTNLRIMPYATPEAGGVMFALNF
jgi:hypothetical protein